jgi:hypothetical protein
VAEGGGENMLTLRIDVKIETRRLWLRRRPGKGRGSKGREILMVKHSLSHDKPPIETTNRLRRSNEIIKDRMFSYEVDLHGWSNLYLLEGFT